MNWMSPERKLAARNKCIARGMFFTNLQRANECVFTMNSHSADPKGPRVQVAQVVCEDEHLGYMVLGMSERTKVAKSLGEDYVIHFLSN